MNKHDDLSRVDFPSHVPTTGSTAQSANGHAPTMADAAEMLWVVLANVSGGDWTKQSLDWQEAAARWRDQYFAALTSAPARAWTCFHCGETFTTPGGARDHFGETPDCQAGCLIDRVALEEGGQPERGRGLLMALRKSEAKALAADKHRQFLFKLLDDIDTEGDIHKENLDAYRWRVEKIQRRRFEVASTDGYVVHFNDDGTRFDAIIAVAQPSERSTPDERAEESSLCSEISVGEGRTPPPDPERI